MNGPDPQAKGRGEKAEPLIDGAVDLVQAHSSKNQSFRPAWPERFSRHRNSRRRLRTSIESARSEEHTSELQSLMRISYAVFCLKKKKTTKHKTNHICLQY